MAARIDAFLQTLVAFPPQPNVFNPWRDYDSLHDFGAGAAAQRTANLRAYLNSASAARVILVGEAAGYRGCKFSGIPFTSEAQLGSGHLTGMKRTSRRSTQNRPFREASATILWEFTNKFNPPPGPLLILFWNAFPFHPYREGHLLSNRKPTRVQETGHILEAFLELFPAIPVFPLGRVAEAALTTLTGIASVRERIRPYIRHPASGGAAEFNRAIRERLADWGIGARW
jgi:uracil-DNA glycosylase